MSTKRRMTWKTGIPFIILCIVIGLLVGWLADRAFATEELIPVSDNVASVGTPRQGVRKFKRTCTFRSAAEYNSAIQRSAAEP